MQLRIKVEVIYQGAQTKEIFLSDYLECLKEEQRIFKEEYAGLSQFLDLQELYRSKTAFQVNFGKLAQIDSFDKIKDFCYIFNII